jgi:hypothetical protein
VILLIQGFFNYLTSGQYGEIGKFLADFADSLVNAPAGSPGGRGEHVISFLAGIFPGFRLDLFAGLDRQLDPFLPFAVDWSICCFRVSSALADCSLTASACSRLSLTRLEPRPSLRIQGLVGKSTQQQPAG